MEAIFPHPFTAAFQLKARLGPVVASQGCHVTGRLHDGALEAAEHFISGASADNSNK